MPGPVPKRDAERVRRNKPVIETDVIEITGGVEIPELDIVNPHPMIVDFYDSLAESAQSRYYEPSDWQLARFTMHFANDLIWQSKPSAMMLQTINGMLADLLVSEGQRRRVRMEIERQAATGTVIDVASMFRSRLGAA